jgi:hypothetical protein
VKNYKVIFLMCGLFLIFGIAFGFLNAEQNITEETVIEDNDLEAVEEVSDEETEVVEEPVESEEVAAKTTITLDEFNTLFNQDPEEEQIKEGKFQLADGSIVYADHFSYGKSEIFEYAMAIFYESELAQVQFETQATPEEIQEALGITFDDATVEETYTGYEVTFNDMFHESNISVYPFEWE